MSGLVGPDGYTQIEQWLDRAPEVLDLEDGARDALDALIDADMVQYNPDGWDFKLHEKHPDAPRALFKIMIREAAGVNIQPDTYSRLALPMAMQAEEAIDLASVDFVLGYPNAGTPIARAVVEQANRLFGYDLRHMVQNKDTHPDGSRSLGGITTEHEEHDKVLAVDDTSTGGDTKVEGFNRIVDARLENVGLGMVVERDPLATALIERETGQPVTSVIHLSTLLSYAVERLDLPQEHLEGELRFPLGLYEYMQAA